jgi:uncharacterized protein
MPSSRSATRLDPRGPLVLDTRELGRRAGAMRPVERSVPAPDDWALDLVRVPPGSPVELDLRLESVLDGVLVSGEVHAEVVGECGRCLEPVRLDVDVQELFTYDPVPAGEGELPSLQGDFIDFEPVARDAVVLGLPQNPVCADDCAGLCPGCGEALRDLPADHDHGATDPRWDTLAELTPADPTHDTATAPETRS